MSTVRRDRLTPRRTVRRERSHYQKIREMILVVFDVDKKEIALTTGVDPGILSNIFNDRHRSPNAERDVIEFLDGRLAGLDKRSRDMLRRLGVTGDGIGREIMGWPLPHTKSDLEQSGSKM